MFCHEKSGSPFSFPPGPKIDPLEIFVPLSRFYFKTLFKRRGPKISAEKIDPPCHH